MFEITTLAARDTATIDLSDAADQPLIGADGQRLSVTVYGPGSASYVKAQTARTQRLMDRMAGGKKHKMNAEEQLREQADFLTACTVSLNGWTYKGAADADAIRALYLDPSVGFIAAQIARAIDDWANFTPGSVKS